MHNNGPTPGLQGWGRGTAGSRRGGRLPGYCCPSEVTLHRFAQGQREHVPVMLGHLLGHCVEDALPTSGRQLPRLGGGYGFLLASRLKGGGWGPSRFGKGGVLGNLTVLAWRLRHHLLAALLPVLVYRGKPGRGRHRFGSGYRGG